MDRTSTFYRQGHAHGYAEATRVATDNIIHGAGPAIGPLGPGSFAGDLVARLGADGARKRLFPRLRTADAKVVFDAAEAEWARGAADGWTKRYREVTRGA